MAVDKDFDHHSDQWRLVGLGDTFRALRKREGISQRELGARMGMHPNTVMKLEQVPEQMAFGTLMRAAAALHQDLGKIIRHVEKSQAA